MHFFIARSLIFKRLSSPGIDSASVCSLAELIPWNRFLGSLNVYEFGLRFDGYRYEYLVLRQAVLIWNITYLHTFTRISFFMYSKMDINILFYRLHSTLLWNCGTKQLIVFKAVARGTGVGTCWIDAAARRKCCWLHQLPGQRHLQGTSRHLDNLSYLNLKTFLLV